MLMRVSPLLGDCVQSPWRSSRISRRAHLRTAPQRADGVRACIPAGVLVKGHCSPLNDRAVFPCVERNMSPLAWQGTASLKPLGTYDVCHKWDPLGPKVFPPSVQRSPKTRTDTHSTIPCGKQTVGFQY